MTATSSVEVPNATSPSVGAPAGRVLSVDAFRGLTIAAMIVVNDPGTWSAVFAPLRHAEWNGCTPTDLVFPFFLFIVGVSMVFSFESRRKRGASRSELLKHVVQRGLTIFAIGLAMNCFGAALHFDISKIRIPGVLQRIGICYIFGALIFLYLGRRARVLMLLGLLGGYWVAMRFIAVPGFGPGVLTPEGNLAAYIDRMVFRAHLYRPMWDPEGILSSLPAVGTLLLGTFTGEWIRSSSAASKKVLGLIVAGIIGIALGKIIDPYFPINKNLWTSSYVLYAGGLAALCLGILQWIVDVRGYQRWTLPVKVFGSNAILAYITATVLAILSFMIRFQTSESWNETLKGVIYRLGFSWISPPELASLCYALSFMLFVWAIMAILYRKGIFWKV